MAVVMRALAVPFAFLAFHTSIQPLPPALRTQMTGDTWHAGCPVPLSELRVLTVTHWGFDRRAHTGRLIVNRDVAAPLARVFRRLYELRFPIRTMRLADTYDPGKPGGSDATVSFHCRRVASSPCPGARSSHSWSQHAYGRAVDVNPIENPYVGGCGRTRERASKPYLDRSRLRRGMVTPAVVEAFRSIGWGWGGEWTTTKDYMHFSANGH